MRSLLMVLIGLFGAGILAPLLADATWDEYAEYVKKVPCIDPTPSGESYVSLKSGEAAHLRFPVPKERPVGYWVDTSAIVALSGQGSSYQLILHLDAADGPVAYEGPVTAGDPAGGHAIGDAWNAANRPPANLTAKLTDEHLKQGYVDVFAVALVQGDGWALYKSNPGRLMQAFIAELSPEVKAAMATAKVMQTRGIAVIPAPQRITLTDGDFKLTAQTKVQVTAKADSEDVFAAEDLAEQLREATGGKVEIVKSDAAPGKDVIALRRGTGKAESYRLRVTADGIAATGADAPGLFYAAQTIAQLVQHKGASALIPACNIDDYPSYPLRSMQYDIARGQTVNVEYMKRVIRELARCKLNAIIYYGEDDYKFVKYPFLGRPGTFTPEKAKELSEYAHKYHMQLIPQFESLGHATAVLGHPELKELQEAGSSWVFCTCNPKVWEFVDNVFAELVEQFPYSQCIHVGADEFEDGFGLCPECKAKVAQVGLVGLYAEHMNKLNALCRKYKRTMLFWPSHGASTEDRSYLTLKSAKADGAAKMQLDCIPTEWIYHGPASYPEIKQYLDAGFKDCWTSPAVVCFSIIWPDYETTFRAIRGMLRAGVDDGVKGTCTTTWEWMYGGMFNNSWLGMMYVPECAWSLGNTPREDYERRFATRFYGVSGDDLGQRVTDTLAQPFPTQGGGAQNRNSTLIKDILWCDPLQVRPHFVLRIPGLTGAAPDMLKAADEALARASALRKDATRNADLLQAAELAFRLHRVAALKLIAFDTAAKQYRDAAKLTTDDPKTAAAKATQAADTVASLIPRYQECADEFSVDIDRFGHWPGDRDACLRNVKALAKLSDDIKTAAAALAAGTAKELPPATQYGLMTGTYSAIGGWEPKQMSTDGCELRFDLSGKLTKANAISVELTYERGSHGLDIQRVALLRDGVEVSVDEHGGWTGAGSRGNIYVLKLAEVTPGAKYEIVAKVKSSGGTDSAGSVWLVVPE